MFEFSEEQILVIAAAFILAGVVKGVTGMGLPIVAMGVLGAMMPPLTAASLLIVPSFVTNVWQLLTGPSFGALASRLWPMLLGLTGGTVAGARLLVSADAQWTTVALGTVLATYAAFSLMARRSTVPPRMERWLSPLTGLATGVIAGATGIFSIPAVPYLQALDLSKDDLVQALGLSFTVSTIALAIGLGHNGAFELAGVVASTVAVVPALLGLAVGQLVRHRIAAETFRRWFLIGFVALGLDLALRPLL
jgi:uncharacterized membrane protein YfcA